MVNGITFSERLMTSKDFAHFVYTMLGNTNGVTKGCEISTANNMIYVQKGYFVQSGRMVQIVGTEEISTPEVQSGQLYCKVVFEFDMSKKNTADNFGQGYFKTLTSAAGYPEVIQEDLGDTGTIHQMTWATYIKTVNGVSDFKDLRSVYDKESVWKVVIDQNAEYKEEFDSYYAAQKEVIDQMIEELEAQGFVSMETFNALSTEVNETKKSVSDGKTLIAAAITGKKVETAADASFAVMADNISQIICGSGTATPADVLKGVTFTGDDGIEREGTLDVQSILSFSAAPYSTSQITFTWKNPAKGAFSGVIIVGKKGSYPTGISDGTRWYKGAGSSSKANGTSSVVVDGFAVGTKYYFRAFSYAVKNNAEWIGGSLTATATTTAKGTKAFTSSGVFTVPANVRSIDVFCVGGGGSGGGCGETSQGNPSTAGGGGGGYTSTKKSYAVTPGQEFTVTIGAGAAAKSGYGGKGGTTSFGSVVSAKGGYGGVGASKQEANGGNGGSGGGGADSLSKVYPGGSDGSDGTAGMVSYAPGENYMAKGQGTTTRAFGETTGTLYAGGGGADSSKATGAGGEGGGGSGRQDGTANTGGGGGGYGSSTTSNPNGGAGGSGICIVRWGY